MLDITRMLTDKKFRKETLSYCTDTVVLQFWNVEFNSWTEKFQAEAIAPILNKVGAFTANPIIRNIIGQPKSTFNIRQIMDEGKILVVNLSKGLLGEDNSSILGSFLVTKIQLAAMSRSDIPNIEDRRPFYLYVDEFQNFATDSFATILSEARKYGLNLTVANQYISQMSDTVRGAVFGNVGTMISFRVSADDAPILAKQFEPQFEPNDLLQMANRNFIINMVISGEKVPAFSARTLQLPPAQADNSPAIIENTRTTYGKTREEVETAINNLISPPDHLQRKGPGNPGFKPQPHENDKQALESAAQAKQWPIDTGAKPVAPAEPNRPKIIADTPAGQAALGQEPTTPVGEVSTTPAEGEKPKRKRTRSRRKKSTNPETGGHTTDKPAPTRPTDAPQPSRSAVEHKPSADPTKLNIAHKEAQKSIPTPAPKAAEPEGLLKIR